MIASAIDRATESSAPSAVAAGKTPGLKTEMAWLRLGELDIACIPGEIYPELVLDKVQDPADQRR